MVTDAPFNVTMPVRFWIQVEAVFQFAAPVTRVVTVAAVASDPKRTASRRNTNTCRL